MNSDNCKLTLEDVRVLLDSIRYGIDKIRHYPYTDENHRRASLQPLQDVQDKLRAIRDELKGNS